MPAPTASVLELLNPAMLLPHAQPRDRRECPFGFGVVFSDVDIPGGTSLTFFDVSGALLGVFNAELQNGGSSFLGVSFDTGERVGSVRINSGSAVLGLGVVDGGPFDVVLMDDFIYSELQAIVSEPGARC